MDSLYDHSITPVFFFFLIFKYTVSQSVIYSFKDE